MSAADLEPLVRARGLLRPGRPVVALLSGGRDSVCLLDVAVRIAGPEAVLALHVNYGLRGSADDDEALCRELCGRLGVALEVHRPRRPEGNLQAWARDRRYAEAARLALARDARIATGHTSSDQVETVLYRLAASPGRRALLGMPEREGRLVRPLLGVSREQTAAHCAARGLPWADDPTNASPAFARNRLRQGLLPALRELHPAAEANVLRTLGVLRDEASVLDGVVADALARAGDPPDVARLRALAPALARLAVQALADREAGGRAPALAGRTGEILALGEGGGSAALDVGGGLRAIVEYGRLRFELGAAAPAAAPDAPVAAALPVPGRARFAGGELVSERGPEIPIDEGSRGPRAGHVPPGSGAWTATLDAAALAPPLEVRAWRPGDRMRPLGLGGSRSLQDLFTDRKVPRERRGAIPVVVSDGEVAWVPGVATGERFRVTDATRDRVRLTWTAAGAALS